MSNTQPAGIPIEQGAPTWDILASQLDAFIQRWDSATEPPALAEFIPNGSATLRRLVLVELIKVDLDYRWTRHMPRYVEDYTKELPELVSGGGVPSDLIFEEFRIRKQVGEAVYPEEYFARFPEQVDELRRLLGLNALTQSTLSRGSRAYQRLQPGGSIDDFDLLAQVGEGAFARVFLARQRSMQRLLALKVSADRGAEAQTLAQLDHPHIVRVFDQRVLPNEGLRLLYMQYLPGGTLQDVLKKVRETPLEKRTGKLLVQVVDEALAKRGEVPPMDAPLRRMLAGLTWPESVCWLGARLAEALDYAHRQGILHRDIKPANVLLGADNAPRLADFNVGCSSKLEGAGAGSFFGGSLGYMAPEQIEAFNPAHPRQPEQLDARCDIYSLGLTLWELLTGQRPFPKEQVGTEWVFTLSTLAAQRRAGLPESAFAQLPPYLPPGLCEVLCRCLEGDPERRFATAGELARQLDLCLKPRTRDLLYPKQWWRTVVRRHALIVLYAIGLIPNIFASWFSIVYNDSEIVRKVPGTEAMFKLLQVIVNGTFFPIGMAAAFMIIWPVVTGLRRLRACKLSTEELQELRGRSLFIGMGIVLICLTMWITAGIVFPISMSLAVRELPTEFYVHFLVSQTLCGLIAVSYPYFLLSFVVMRAVYPAFLVQAELTAEDVRQLNLLNFRLGIALILAGVIPFLCIFLIVVLGSGNKMALAVLSAAGLAGVALAVILVKWIRDDRSALLTLAPNLVEKE
ncbi:MAG TPA: serine/threonine-protein kinase [Gemmataceae bacterium]|nr:serine/threonine-protein kinase [Gemmataceae bacterium]